MNYHHLIKARREKLNKTQKEIGDKACTSRVTVSRVERGMSCHIDTFLTIIDALGLKMEIRKR